MNIKYKIKGITLVALVVTIIVLLILSGTAISLTLGDDGKKAFYIKDSKFYIAVNKYEYVIDGLELLLDGKDNEGT